SGNHGFTLIEIMIVVGMIAIVMAFGIPAAVENQKKAPMRQAVSDLTDACKAARAQAIETGKPAELVIDSDGGIRAGAFAATLDRDIQIRKIAVNFEDMENVHDVHVRFFPNGTSDEFSMHFQSSQQEVRLLVLDVVTGLPDIQIVQ